ncbi:hypothetical protein M758_UG252000 [Ceratodon purpureus]|nr:hypothetical protein M758_UG252000 [Ceratodon purpureus]
MMNLRTINPAQLVVYCRDCGEGHSEQNLGFKSLIARGRRDTGEGFAPIRVASEETRGAHGPRCSETIRHLHSPELSPWDFVAARCELKGVTALRTAVVTAVYGFEFLICRGAVDGVGLGVRRQFWVCVG